MRCRLVRVASEQPDVPEGVTQGRAPRRTPGGGETRLFDPEVEVEDPNTKVLEALTPPKALWMSKKTEVRVHPEKPREQRRGLRTRQ